MSLAVKNAGDRIRDVVVRAHMFSQWPPALIDKLLEGAELRRYEDGETAVRYRDASPYLCLVARGCFVCRHPRANDEPAIADFILPGQATSYLSGLDGFPAAFDTVASGESELIFIPRSSLAEALAMEPARYQDIIAMLCRRLRREHENTFMRTANTVRCQLARVILYWARGQTGKGARIIGVSQEDIAAMLGKSRPTINKEIGVLIAEGVLARSYRQIHILNMQALVDIVERENPGTLKLNEAVFGKPNGVLMTSD